MSESELGDECSICLRSSLILDKTLSCGQSCHKECIDKWLDKEYTCPNCRCLVTRDFKVKVMYPPTFFNPTYTYSIGENCIEIRKRNRIKEIILYEDVRGIIYHRNNYAIDFLDASNRVTKRITVVPKRHNLTFFNFLKHFLDQRYNC